MLSLTAPTKLSNLKKEDLLQVQSDLKKLKYDCGQLDGIFGEKTLNAFNRFKQDHGLTNPDEIGPTTLTFLSLAIKKEFDPEEKEDPHADQPSFTTKLKIPPVIDWFNFECPVSKYFTVGEVSRFSSERIVINPIHKDCVLSQAARLDKIREDWGAPIGVTSWYRPPRVNRKVGGAINSQHLTGTGVDIYPITGNGLEFEQWLDKRWERALGWGQRKNRGFTHIDSRSQPKRIRWNY